MSNYLICWEENNIKQWDMVKEDGHQSFLMNLLLTEKVNQSSIFVIPTTGISGIWLDPGNHKSNRVDFWNFFEDYGLTYTKPVPKKGTEAPLREIQERHSDNTKYGFVSPEGKYFHCGYQGHSALADRICFGMVETNNAEHYLETHGWCKIYKPLSYNTYSVYMGGKSILTEAQVKTLFELGLENAKDLKDMIQKD